MKKPSIVRTSCHAHTPIPSFTACSVTNHFIVGVTTLLKVGCSNSSSTTPTTQLATLIFASWCTMPTYKAAKPSKTEPRRSVSKLWLIGTMKHQMRSFEVPGLLVDLPEEDKVEYDERRN